MDKSELDDIVGIYQTVSNEVDYLIVEMTIKISKEKVEVLKATPTKVELKEPPYIAM